MKHVLVSKKGFTLVELLIYSGILMIFLAAMTRLFTIVLDAKLESESTAAVEEDRRFIFNRLEYDVGRAQGITTPSALGGQSSSIQLTIAGSSYTYAVTNGNLMLISPSGTDMINSIGSTIASFSAQKLGNVTGIPTLRVTMTITSTTTRVANPETRTFQTTIGLR